MDPVSPWFALAAISLAILTASAISRIFRTPQKRSSRLLSIDGLRGYLALGVFLHHVTCWFFYIHTGKWASPPSIFYAHLGGTSVSLFFMITAFLFWTKLLNGRDEPVKWCKLYISRILRLSPLWLFTVVAVFLIVAFASHLERNVSYFSLFYSGIRWVFFTFPSLPNINGYAMTGLIICSASWSLLYEWIFYIALPLGSIVVGVIPPWRWVFFSVTLLAVITCALVISTRPIYPSCFLTFLGGIAASYLVRSERLRSIAVGKVCSVIAMACFIAIFGYLPASSHGLYLCILTLGFAIVACGNSLFGILNWPSSLLLGEASYSIYLLHGIILYIPYKFIIGPDKLAAFSTVQYWSLVFAFVPLLVLFSFGTFLFIESPGIASMKPVYLWFSKHFLEKNTEVTWLSSFKSPAKSQQTLVDPEA